MKFSFPVLKSYLPEIKNKTQVIELLSMYSFEAEDAGGSLIEIKLPPNRYSDCGSYIGIANELSAILNVKKRAQNKILATKSTKTPRAFSVSVENKELCPRYCAQYFENIKIKESPKWLRDALISSGMRPINNVVDVMNYVMLEVGQPMHAFDFDLLSPTKKPTISIRSARKGEKIMSLDSISYTLDQTIGVIADNTKTLVIAGIKGGMGCEVHEDTKRILVEAASFNPVSIYKTTKKINLSTDASQRFVHSLSPDLPAYALSRAAFLLKEVACATVGERYDSGIPERKKVVSLNVDACNALLGTRLSQKDASGVLSRLGFVHTKSNIWEVPPFRTDIETPEDVAEEIARIVGYQNIPALPSKALITSPEENVRIIIKEKSRGILRALGFNELYNHSFVSKESLQKGFVFEGSAVPLINPPSSEFEFLRPTLLSNVSQNIKENSKYYDDIKIFEIGSIFTENKGAITERCALGISFFRKNGETFFELKGILDYLLKGVGIDDFSFVEMKTKKESLFFSQAMAIVSQKTVLGFFGFTEPTVSYIELDLDAIAKMEGNNFQYKEIEKYPRIVRDISLFTDLDVRIGELIEEIMLSNSLVKSVDLIDEYIDEKWANLQSITFRLIFQSDERTLRSEEVDEAMGKIIKTLEKKFSVKMR